MRRFKDLADRNAEGGRERPERIQHRLAAVQEHPAIQPLERLVAAHIGSRRTEFQANDRGGDLWRRTERPGRKRQQPLGVGQQLGLHRQRAVRPGAGTGDEPVRHLLLKHDGCIAEPAPFVGRLEQPEENGGGDVVGKVADDAQRRRMVPGEIVEGDRQDVALDQPDVGRQTARKRRRQVAVDLHCDELPHERRERTRERPPARPNLDEHIVGCGLKHLEQPRHPGGLQVVLAEALARPRKRSVTRGHRDRRRRLSSSVLRSPRFPPR